LKCVLIVVLGHEDCGAVKAAVDQVTNGTTVPGHIGAVVDPIIPAVQAAKAQDPADLIQASIRENIRMQVQQLRTSMPILAPLVQSGKLTVVGAEYTLKTGAVERVS
jgi:carbonic anhydrase